MISDGIIQREGKREGETQAICMKTYIVDIVFIIITNFITKFDVLIKTIFDKGDRIVDAH